MTERKLNKVLVEKLIEDFETRLAPYRDPDPDDWFAPFDPLQNRSNVIRPDGKDFYDYGNYGWYPGRGIEMPCCLGGHVARLVGRENPSEYYALGDDGIHPAHKLAADIGVSNARGVQIFCSKDGPRTAHEALDLLCQLIVEDERSQAKKG